MAEKESSYGFEETMVTLTDEDGLEKDFYVSMMRQQTLMRRFWIPGCGTGSLKGNRAGVCSGC